MVLECFDRVFQLLPLESDQLVQVMPILLKFLQTLLYIIGLLVTRRGLIIVGGMAKGQQVIPNVAIVKTSPAK